MFVLSVGETEFVSGVTIGAKMHMIETEPEPADALFLTEPEADAICLLIKAVAPLTAVNLRKHAL